MNGSNPADRALSISSPCIPKTDCHGCLCLPRDSCLDATALDICLLDGRVTYVCMHRGSRVKNTSTVLVVVETML